ncbi:MAG: POTRA domain-containing protein, partial [bacterium]|nr:POTRA domain-containing protein [bacterium]
GPVTAAKEQILGILPFKPGDPFSPSALNAGVENLKKWGIFDTVRAETKPTSEGVIVKLILHQGEIVSLIDIKGNYPYVETKIIKRLSLQVGDMVTPEKLEEQQTRIKSFYEKMGYYNTEVEVGQTPGEEENNIELVFHVYKGDRLRYEKVAFEGVEAFRRGRMSSFVRPMDIYSDKRLRQAVRDLEDFYRRRGYLKIRENVTDKKIDWDRNRVSVKLKVSEGPRVRVFFTGNQPFRTTTLKKASELFEEVNFDVIELEDSSEKIAEYLRKNGYPEAKVSFKKKKLRSDLYHIFFHVEPGPRQFIYSVDFEGNDSVSAGKLKKQIYTKERSLTQKGVLDGTLLPEDQSIAVEYYQSKGFLDARVGEPDLIVNKEKTRMDIVFPIEEGERVFVAEVLFQGNTIHPDKKLMKAIKNKKGEPVNDSYLPVDLEQVKAFYANNGHPYATVEQKIQRSGNELTILYTIEEGPLVTIGEILILGDVLSSMRAIRQGLEFKTGDPYSYQKIINSRLNLRRLGAFSSVHINTIGIEEKETVIHIKVEVEEREPFTFSVEGQYSTDLKWAGTTRFNNLNAFGWGKQMSLLLRGGTKTNHAELSWFDPRFTGRDLQMTTSGWVDYFKNPLETSLQTGGAFSFFRQFHRFGFLTRYELQRTYNIQGQAINPQNLRDNTLSQIT